MSEMASAQETFVNPSEQIETGHHAAGPGDRPVPGDPAPAAPTHICERCGRVTRDRNTFLVCEAANSTAFDGHVWVPLRQPIAEHPGYQETLTACGHIPAECCEKCAGPTETDPAAPKPAWSRRMPGKDKVAIVGFSTNHRHLAPVDDETYEIWGMNNAYVHLKRADRWFELHSEDQYGWDLRRPGDHVKWLKGFDGPLYLIEARADMPNSISFPYAEVCENTGPYMTSGPALMLAFAMLEGFREIAIYGIDLMTTSEYADQKASFEFLIGMAMGKGIEIVLPNNCQLLRAPVYGRGDINAGGERRTRAQFEGRLKALAKAKTEAIQRLRQDELAVARLEGAELESRYWVGQTPEGADQGEMLRRIAAEKGRGGVLIHPTGDLADGV